MGSNLSQQTAERLYNQIVAAGRLSPGAKLPNDPQNYRIGIIKRDEAGEGAEQFLSAYLAALSAAYMAEEQGKVAAEYLNSLSEEQLATKENWELVKKNVSDP